MQSDDDSKSPATSASAGVEQPSIEIIGAETAAEAQRRASEKESSAPLTAGESPEDTDASRATLHYGSGPAWDSFGAATVDDPRFEVAEGRLKLRDGVALDAEAEPSVRLTLTATDAGGLTTSRTLQLQVGDVNDAPDGIVLDAAPLLENAAGADLGAVRVSDADAGDRHTLRVDDPRFEVAEGRLKLRDGVALDAEAEPSVRLTLTATDAGGLTTSRTLQLQVGDVNDAPDGIVLDAAPLLENAAGADLGAVRVSDADAGDRHTLRVDDPRFEVAEGRLKLRDGVALDAEAEPSVRLTLTATDAGGLTTSRTLQLQVGDVNDAPDALHISATSLPSSEDLVLWLDGQDRNGDFEPDASGTRADGTWIDKSGAGSTGHLSGPAPTVDATGLDFSDTSAGYRISGNADLNRGTFPEKTFALSFETGDTVDGVQMIYEQGGTVRGYSLSIAPDPETGDPTIWGLAYNRSEWDTGHQHKPLNLGVAEPETYYNIVLVHDATDPDPAAQIFCGYVDGVLVDQANHVGVQYNHPDAAGVGNLNNGTVLAHTGKSFKGDIPFEGTISEVMSWNGVLDPEEVSALDGHFMANRNQVADGVSVFETAQSGTVVATLSASDQDAGDQLSYRIVDEAGTPTENSRFEIEGASIRLRPGAVLDHETETHHEINVQVIDSGGLTRTETLSIKVLDVDEAPTDIQLDTSTVADTVAPGDVIGTLTATDPEGGALSFTFVGSQDRAITHDTFEIVGNEVRLRPDATLNFEQQAQFDLTVQVIDTGGNVAHETIRLDISDGNQAPVSVTIDNLDVRGADFGAVVGRFEVQDTDAGDRHSFSVSDARFTVEDGVLRLHDDAALDPLADADLTLSVTATDRFGDSVTEDMTLNVADALDVRMETGFHVAVHDIDPQGGVPADFDWSAPPDRVSLSPDLASIPGTGPAAVRITGQIDVSEPGDYTFFHGSSDGTTLLINGAPVAVDPDDGSATITLRPGAHGIEIRQFDPDGDTALSWEWEGPGLDARAAVSPSPDLSLPANGMIALGISVAIDPTPPTPAGFSAQYFDFDHRLSRLSDVDWTGTPDHAEVVDTIDYKNGSDSFWEGGSTETFAARLTGDIAVEEGGTFTFHLGADDGTMLYINGEPMLDNDGLHSFRTRSTDVELEPGHHQIEVRYFENTGQAGLKLEWEGPGIEGRSLVTSAPDDTPSDPLETARVELTGLPTDSLLFSGTDTAVSDGGPVDVTGWDLSVLEFAPPPGFTGAFDLGVRVTPPDGSDQPMALSEPFSIQVTDDTGEIPQFPDGPDDTIHFDTTDTPGWAEDAFGADPDLSDQDAARDTDILSEDVMLLPDAEVAQDLHETHDRHDW